MRRGRRRGEEEERRGRPQVLVSGWRVQDKHSSQFAEAEKEEKEEK